MDKWTATWWMKRADMPHVIYYYFFSCSQHTHAHVTHNASGKPVSLKPCIGEKGAEAAGTHKTWAGKRACFKEGQ